MKIAILSSFYPYRGGIAQFNANIFQELSTLHEVKAFNFSRQYPSILFPGKTQLVEEGDSAIKIPSISLLDTANPISYIKTSKIINNVFKTNLTNEQLIEISEKIKEYKKGRVK